MTVLTSAHQKKLTVLFGALPEAQLRQLHGAFEAQFAAGADDIPYDILSDLTRDAMARRGIFVPLVLGDEPDAASDEVLDLSHMMKLPATIPEPAVAASPEPVEVAPAPVPVEPVIVKVKRDPVRPRNAMHAFFLPLETLIIDPPKFTDRIDGYICSTSLPTIWRLLNEEASGGAIRDSWIRYELQAGEAQKDLQQQITETMYEAAKQTLNQIVTEAENSHPYRRQIVARLGDETIYHDLCELYRLLDHAWALQAFALEDMPEHVVVGHYLSDIATTILAQSQISQPVAAAMLRSVLTRTDDWSTMLVLQKQIERTSIAPVPDAMLVLIPDYLTQILKQMIDWVEREVSLDAMSLPVLRTFDRLVALVTSVRNEGDGVSYGTLTEGLEVTFGQVGDLFDRLMRQAQLGLRDALPLIKNDQDVLQPDPAWMIGNPAAEIIIARGQTAAGFLARAYKTAATVRKTAHYQRVMSPVLAQLETYGRDLTGIVRHESGDRRLAAVKLSDHVIEISDTLLGESHTDEIRNAIGDAARAA